MACCSGSAWLLSILALWPRPELHTGTTETPASLAKATTSFGGTLASLLRAALQTCSSCEICCSGGGGGRSGPPAGPPLGVPGLSGGVPGVLDVVGGTEEVADCALAVGTDSESVSDRAAMAPSAGRTCFIIMSQSPSLREIGGRMAPPSRAAFAASGGCVVRAG